MFLLWVSLNRVGIKSPQKPSLKILKPGKDVFEIQHVSGRFMSFFNLH